MGDKENQVNIGFYVGMVIRRKWWIVIPLVIGIVLSFFVFNYLPKFYRATTLILVQPQKIPESYIRPTITETVNDRLNTLSQEILSRTRLEGVIQEFNLYTDLREKVPMEAIVEIMRKAIEVRLQSSPAYTQNSFSITYEGTEPKKVMMVTNKLASLFIEQNLRVRGQQAEVTSQFLSKTLLAQEDSLKRKETELARYKQQHMGQLPEQLDANLRILERLQQQLQTTTDNIRSLEDRAILISSQIEQFRERDRIRATVEAGQGISGRPEGVASPSVEEDPIITRWSNLKQELTNAQSKYTDNHPDVIDLERKISSLEPKVKELQEKQRAIREAYLRRQRNADATGNPSALIQNPADEALFTQYMGQLKEIQLNTKRLKAEEATLKEQIALYRKRVEDTPKLEQELIVVSRDYDLMKSNYQSVLEKKIQAEMAENLEKRQQGEQFKILDLARTPEKPFKPERNKVLLIGAIVSLGLGLGLAYFREYLDQSFRTVSEVETELRLPVLATIPNLKEDRKAA